MRRVSTFWYDGRQVSERETWGDVVGRLFGLAAVLAVAAVPILVLTGRAPHWFWVLF